MLDTNVLILGLVRWLQPVHGYEVNRELMSWSGGGDWYNVKPGAIYHGLKRLASRGLLDVVNTERVDNRPARTTYRITTEGEAEFQRLLRAQLWELGPAYDPFFSAWGFVTVLSHREAAAMLRNRAALLRDRIESIAIRDTQAQDPRRTDFLPRHVEAAMGLARERLTVEERWCRETADRVEAGELYDESNDPISPETAAHWKAHIATLDASGQPRRDKTDE